MYKNFFKRVIDIVVSFLALLILAVPMVIFAIVIKIDSPGPVFFKQKRIAIHKKTFNILKFRSMPVNMPKDVPTENFNAEDMLSKWQKFIRKTSIDELPQLINILLGDMSIIGPRPALWNQYKLIEERDKYGANDVKPGLTGWGQINGRAKVGDEVKAALDGEYVKRMSFLFDCRCFFGTIPSIFNHDGDVENGIESVKEKTAAANAKENAEKK